MLACALPVPCCISILYEELCHRQCSIQSPRSGNVSGTYVYVYLYIFCSSYILDNAYFVATLSPSAARFCHSYQSSLQSITIRGISVSECFPLKCYFVASLPIVSVTFVALLPIFCVILWHFQTPVFVKCSFVAPCYFVASVVFWITVK